MSGRAPRHRESAESASAFQQLLPYLAVVWLAIYWAWFFTTQLPNNPDYTRLVVALQLPELYASLFAGGSPQSPSGWRYLPQRFDLIAGAVFIVLSGFCLGRRLLSLLAQALSCLTGEGSPAEISRAERLAIAGGVGLSALSLLTLVLGLSGLLNQWLFAALFLAIIVWDGVESWRTRPLADPGGQAAVPARSPVPRWLKGICLAVAVPFLFCILLGAMQPPTDFDVREYHLQGPKEYWLAGRVHLLEHNVYTSFPFLTEMLSLAAMTLRGDWFRGALTGQLVLAAFAPLTALGAYCVARRVAGAAAGWLAATVYLSIPWTYRISIIAYTEGALCGYVILTCLAFQIWAERSRNPDARNLSACWLLVTGFLAGSAVATKYPGMVLVAIPYALAVCVTSWRRDASRSADQVTAPFSLAARVRNLTLSVSLYGIGVVAAFGPWMAKNLSETGNPVYPLLGSVFESRDWSPEMNDKWRRAHGPPPGNFFGHAREDVIGLLGYNDWHSPLLIGFLPLALAIPERRRLIGVGLSAAVIVACWFLLTHRIDRFWVPVNPLLAVFAGCGLAVAAGLADRDLQGHSAVKISSGLRFSPKLQLVILGMVVFAVIFQLGFVVSGLSGPNAFLLEETVARERYRARSLALLESLPLPAGARVLFVGEAEVFDATFDHRYNTVFDESLLEQWTARRIDGGDWKLLAGEEIREKLSREGITHVFINWNEILRYRLTYGYTDFVSPQRIAEIAERGRWRAVPEVAIYSQREWDSLNPQEQQELRNWAPELIRTQREEQRMVMFELYEVPE